MTNLLKSTALAAVVTIGALASVSAAAMPAYEPVGATTAQTGIETFNHSRDRRYYRDGYHDGSRYYGEPVYRNTRTWRGRDGRYYCRRGNGTTGLIIGGAAGALLGREIDGGYNRSTGTILGAAGGALLGRSIDRDRRCR